MLNFNNVKADAVELSNVIARNAFHVGGAICFGICGYICLKSGVRKVFQYPNIAKLFAIEDIVVGLACIVFSVGFARVSFKKENSNFN